MIGGFSPWFSEELQRRIEALKAERASSLIAGTAADYAGYCRDVGFAEGLTAALDIADEIKKDQEKA